MDKLKGHTYDLSPFQYMEVMHHMDPEMQWILHSAGEMLVDDPNAAPKGQFYVSDLFATMADAAAGVLAERLKLDKDDVNAERTARKTLKAYRSFNEPRPKGLHNIADFFMIYVVDDVLRQLRYPND